MARAFKNVITPVATASFTWLERPDSGFEFSDDKYKVTLLFDKESDEGRAFKQKMDEMTQELASQEFGDKIKGIQGPLKDGDETEKEDLHGHWFLRTKTKFQPGLIDCDSPPKPLSSGTFPRNGDKIRAAIKMFAYKAGNAKGVTAMLNTVQLVEQRNSESAGFDDIAGFVADSATELGSNDF